MWWDMSSALPGIVLLAGCLCIGCEAAPRARTVAVSPGQSAATQAAPTTRITEVRELGDQPVTTSLSKGLLPLACMIEHSCEVEVIDTTAGVKLTTFQTDGRALVGVESSRGVTMNGRVVLAGPLHADHTFEIVVRHSGAGAWNHVRELPDEPGREHQ
jgi:hypothetical protein